MGRGAAMRVFKPCLPPLLVASLLVLHCVAPVCGGALGQQLAGQRALGGLRGPTAATESDKPSRDSTVYPIVSPPVPDFDQSHSFEVTFLEAPFAQGLYGNKFGYVNMYHSGLGFRDTTTGFHWAMEYDALNGVVPNATFPLLVDGDDRKGWGLKWLNQGGVVVMPAEESDAYWKRSVKVGTVDGPTLAALVEWADEYNKTHPTYNLWTVRRSRNGAVYLPGCTCYEFAIGALDHLASLGAQLSPEGGRVHYRIFNMYTREQPRPVALEDRENVFSFYKGLQNSRFSLFKMILGWRRKYFFYHDTYYEVRQRFPFVGTHYDRWTPPGSVKVV